MVWVVSEVVMRGVMALEEDISLFICVVTMAMVVVKGVLSGLITTSVIVESVFLSVRSVCVCASVRVHVCAGLLGSSHGSSC